MKYLPLALLSICLLSACKEDPVAAGEIDQVACTLESPRIGANGFIISGGRFDSAAVNLDSIDGQGVSGTRSMEITFEKEGTTTVRIFSQPVAFGLDTGLAYMHVTVPGRSTGTFQLSGQNAGGISVTLDAVAGSFAYFPLRGTLEVSRFDWSDSTRPEIAGRFCGTFKNAAGDTVQITGGSFSTL